MINDFNPVDLLDDRQKAICEHFPDNPYLSTVENVARIIEWRTFYTRNEEYFVEHYLGIHLHPFQAIAIHEMGTHGSGTIVAARSTSKTFMMGLHACSYAILNPGSLIVVASATKDQARIIVYEKIKGELIRDSATLRAEIKSITSGKNDTRVEFYNGATMLVVVGGENAQGHRAHLVILDEFKMMKKEVVERDLQPFLIQHIYPYHQFAEYKNVSPPIGMHCISSSGFCSSWMWGKMRTALNTYLHDGDELALCFDYSVCLKYGIKTREMLEDAYRNCDLITWQTQYCNYMIKENTKAFFTYSALKDCRTLKHHFYPRKNEDVLTNVKNKYAIPKKDGEIRIVTCDIAMINRAGNDNSSFTCIRLIPDGIADENGKQIQAGYKRQVPYMETFPGCETSKQAIRIKQLFYDFNADYCVLDVRNAGISVFDALAKISYDEERNVEYEAWTCFNDDVIAARVPILGSKSVVYAISASAKFNSDIAESLRNVFQSKRIELLVDFDESTDELRRAIPEYFNTTDADIQAYYERPYFETTALINEMIGLEYDVSPQTKLINIHEIGKATKDRYSSLAYGNIFAEYLERDLLSNRSKYEYKILIN